MTIGTSLFAALNTRAFQKSDAKIAQLQENISTGTEDPKASADPIRAQRLSVVNEHKDMLDRFNSNLIVAEKRLEITDSNLGEVNDLLQSMRELAIRGADASVTPSERKVLLHKATQLRDSLITQANARDDTGRPIFGGYQGRMDPFTEGPNGVEYNGDAGRHTLRVSESAMVSTGVSGDEAFMGVDLLSGETRGLFDIVDDFIFTLGSEGHSLRDSVTEANTMSVDLAKTQGDAKWTMTLGEGANAVTISADLVSGQPGPAIAAINAVSTQTGITAAFTDDGDGMVLTGVNGVTLSDIKVEPEQRGEVARAYPEEGVFIQMVSKDRTSSGIIDQITAAGEHVADMRAVVGAQAESVDRFQKLVAERTVILDEAVSNLSELDLAAAITKLQSLLLNREASQSSFVKITSTSLFDYIR